MWLDDWHDKNNGSLKLCLMIMDAHCSLGDFDTILIQFTRE